MFLPEIYFILNPNQILNSNPATRRESEYSSHTYFKLRRKHCNLLMAFSILEGGYKLRGLKVVSPCRPIEDLDVIPFFVDFNSQTW